MTTKSEVADQEIIENQTLELFRIRTELHRKRREIDCTLRAIDATLHSLTANAEPNAARNHVLKDVRRVLVEFTPTAAGQG